MTPFGRRPRHPLRPLRHGKPPAPDAPFAARRAPDPDAAAILARRRRVDAFVDRHFTWRGTLRLHRAALGLDMLKAPVNVLLSPVLVLARLAAWILRRMRRPRAADWLLRRPLLLRTAVSARVETAIATELLGVRLPEGLVLLNGSGLAAAILASPMLRAAPGGCDGAVDARIAADRIAAAIREYGGTRSAIAEFTTALFTLAAGAIAFHTLTPGMISMAPGVAEAVSRAAVIADFPLGETLGELWYGMFPVGPSPWLVALTMAALVTVGSAATALAGIVADPLQARLGIHRRRLMRLLDTVDAEIDGVRHKPFTAREHLLVRIFDLWDAALSLLRVFRS